MLVIIEGPDCSGKSTLTRRLTEYLRTTRPDDVVTMIKKGPPKEHPLDEYVRPLLNYRPNTAGRHVICDRLHWGERIYPYLWSRPTQMDDAVWRYVEMFLRSRGALVVRVVRAIPTHIDCLDTRGDDHGVTSADLTELLRRYDDVRSDSLLPSIAVAANCSDVELEDVVDVARRAELRALQLRRLTTYVGGHDVETLLVGDVRAYIGHPSEPFPAFGPYAATSGHYLLRALIDTEWNFDHIALVNACDVDDMSEVLEVVEPLNVVALGRNAHRRLYQYGIEHATVPHPQYVRRFHNARLSEYGTAIRAAAVSGEDWSDWPSRS